MLVGKDMELLLQSRDVCTGFNELKLAYLCTPIRPSHRLARIVFRSAVANYVHRPSRALHDALPSLLRVLV